MRRLPCADRSSHGDSLGFAGFDFEVHEPPELADVVRRMARRIAAAARR